MDEDETTPGDTMDAVILCAGRGVRIKNGEVPKPKCLIKIGPKTLLERTLENLGIHPVKHIRIVIGFQKESVMATVNKQKQKNIVFIRNPDYDTTNTAASLWLALKQVEDDVVFLNGDVLYDGKILADLIAKNTGNYVVTDAEAELDREAVKVIADGDRITRIGKLIEPDHSIGEAVGINRFMKRDVKRLAESLAQLIKEGKTNSFFEEGIDRICDRVVVKCLDTAGLPWVEIDTDADLEKAREMLRAGVFR